MSFSFLAPHFLWAFLAIPLILALHFIRKRRKKRLVSALFLWKEAQSIAQSQKRFSASWLLILQLAFASMAALALSQPVFSIAGQQDRVFVIDASASMAAKDKDGIRIDKAVAAAKDVLKKSGRVAVIRAGLEARVISPLTDNHQEIVTALKSIQAYDKSADLNRALSLARSVLPGAEIHVFSDTEPAKQKGVIAHSFALESLNIGITAFDVGIQEAFVSISSNHPRPQDVRVVLKRDGETVAQSNLLLPAKGQTSTSFPLSNSSGQFELRIENFDWDSLALDNSAFVSKSDLTVVAKKDESALKRLLTAIPNLSYRVSANTDLNAPSFGLRIVYGKLPANAKGNYLVFNTAYEETAYETIKDWDRSDPLLRFVDLTEVIVAPLAEFIRDDWQVIAQTESLTPVIARYKDNDLNVIALNFHPSQTNMVKRTAFPLLITNIVSHFRAEQKLVLGQRLAEKAFYLKGDKEIAVTHADKPGFYKVNNSLFAVSLLSDNETRLGTFSRRPEAESKQGTAARSKIVRTIAWWLLIVAFVLILLEWLLWAKNGNNTGRERSLLSCLLVLHE